MVEIFEKIVFLKVVKRQRRKYSKMDFRLLGCHGSNIGIASIL